MGLRLAAVDFSTQATNAFSITRTQFASVMGPGGMLTTLPVSTATLPLTVTQRAETLTGAFGVHGAIDGSWDFAQTGVGIFGRADAGLLAAGSRDRYTLGIGGGINVPDSTFGQHGPGLLTTLGLQAGVRYTIPLERVWLRFSAGYGYEAWFLHATGHGAREHALLRILDFSNHGPFGRIELGF
jgi:hypothetical protein